MLKQTTNELLMIEPAAFGFNSQTAANNYFQQKGELSASELKQVALAEFAGMAGQIRSRGISVVVIPDTEEPHTPDAVFPNNWISFHEDKRAVLYPLYAPNRRQERRMDVLEKTGRQDYRITDLTSYESENLFLEGTGSMVLDRVNRVAYAGISERTSKEVLDRFCQSLGYRPVCFHPYQWRNGRLFPVYHTNVMLSVATQYAVVCLDSITDAEERGMLEAVLLETGKKIIPITHGQMNAFAGNMLQVENDRGELFAVISDTALQSLTDDQKALLLEYNDLISVAVPVIEKYGGGSVRCMIAELF